MAEADFFFVVCRLLLCTALKWLEEQCACATVSCEAFSFFDNAKNIHLRFKSRLILEITAHTSDTSQLFKEQRDLS